MLALDFRELVNRARTKALSLGALVKRVFALGPRRELAAAGAGCANTHEAVVPTRNAATHEEEILVRIDLKDIFRVALARTKCLREDGDLAAEEIDRASQHPGFVQVLVTARTSEPLGRRRYWKLYEAAARNNLPVGIHFGGTGGRPLTGAGWPSHYLEDHAGMPQAFQAQVISLVCEGVFERFPELKIVLIEGGLAWIPPLAWRLDRSWERLREEVPYLSHPPSSYIRKHFWITTQPMEEPPQGKYFWQLLEQLDSNDRLLFATDYPHWDFDNPDRALPSHLPPPLRRRILADNARALYRFEA